MKLRQVKWIIEGLIVNARKGLILMIFKYPKSKRDMLENSWGFHDPKLHGNTSDGYVLREDEWLEQETLPRGGKSHHRTDLIVEWSNLSAQRSTKMLCGLATITGIIGLLTGLAIGSYGIIIGLAMGIFGLLFLLIMTLWVI